MSSTRCTCERDSGLTVVREDFDCPARALHIKRSMMAAATLEPPERGPQDQPMSAAEQEQMFSELVTVLRETGPKFDVVDGVLYVPEEGYSYDLSELLTMAADLQGRAVLTSVRGVTSISPIDAILLTEKLYQHDLARTTNPTK